MDLWINVRPMCKKLKQNLSLSFIIIDPRFLLFVCYSLRLLRDNQNLLFYDGYIFRDFE